MAVLTVQDVGFTWKSRDGETTALQSVSAEFGSGTPHIICGPSGSGKTTLGLLIAGLMAVERGTIRLNGQDVSQCRRDFAYVFQFPEQIFFEDTIARELAQIAGSPSLDLIADYARLLDVRLDDIAERHPYHLSEGYSRLVATLLQLARQTTVLIADEPTIGLDWRHHQHMTKLLKRWIRESRILVVITHDLELMKDLGGKAWVLSERRLAWTGETADLLTTPALLERYSLAD